MLPRFEKQAACVEILYLVHSDQEARARIGRNCKPSFDPRLGFKITRETLGFKQEINSFWTRGQSGVLRLIYFPSSGPVTSGHPKRRNYSVCFLLYFVAECAKPAGQNTSIAVLIYSHVLLSWFRILFQVVFVRHSPHHHPSILKKKFPQKLPQ